MAALTVQTINLPDTIEDLSRFVLIGREKLKAVQAQIRAIDKISLAQEVRDQKREEAQMLSGALLDAEARLGDLLKTIPKASGGDRRSEDFKTAIGGGFEKPKAKVVEELGFSETQVRRFETLAENRDLIEQVKQEAREKDEIPTRARVLNLARERERRQCQENNHGEYLSECKKTALKYSTTISNTSNLSVETADLKKWSELLDARLRESELSRVENALMKLSQIRQFLRGVKI